MSQLPTKFEEKKPVSPVLRILTGSHKGKQFRLLSSKIVIGQDSDCDVILKSSSKCSARHAQIQKGEEDYLIESLDPENPVIVNHKPISSKILRSKDKITIGNVEMMFIPDSPVSDLQPFQMPPSQKPAGKKLLTPPRIILLAVCLGALWLFSQESAKPPESSRIDIKTEADILEEVEAIKKLSEEEIKNQNLSSEEKTAQTVFIKGFRDYRKGYFYRALKMFQHCLTVDKNNLLCQSYSQKSKAQIDRLIQKKVRLGNAYKKNKQFDACRAAFKSVETMIQDSKNAVYKEAVASRKLCETYLRNKI